MQSVLPEFTPPLERAHAAWDEQRREHRDTRTFEQAMRAELPEARRCAAVVAQLAHESGRAVAADARADDGGAPAWRFDAARWLHAAKNHSGCIRYWYWGSCRVGDGGACKRRTTNKTCCLYFCPHHCRCPSRYIP